MKIAHYIYDSIHNPWVGGGGAHRNLEIYRRFPKGSKIDIYSGKYPGARSVNHGENTAQYFLGSSINRYLFSRLSYAAYAAKHIKQTHAEYDLIIEDFSPFSPLFSFSLVSRKKMICQLQNYFQWKNHYAKFRIFGTLSWFFEYISLRSFDNMIFSSEDLQKLTAPRTKASLNPAVIPCGIEDDILASGFHTPESDVIAYIGRFEIQQKGLDRLVKIWKRLSERHPGLRFQLAGSGKDEARVADLIKEAGLQDKTAFAGRVEGRLKVEFLQKAKLVMVPSRFESWGIVSLEAQGCCTPVLVSDIEGLRLTVKDNESGCVCNSINDFVRKAEDLLGDPALYSSFSRKGKLNAGKYDWQGLAEKQYDYYSKLLQS